MISPGHPRESGFWLPACAGMSGVFGTYTTTVSFFAARVTPV